jgi:hypothetical protein
MLPFLVPVLFAFDIQGVLKNSGAKGLNRLTSFQREIDREKGKRESKHLLPVIYVLTSTYWCGLAGFSGRYHEVIISAQQENNMKMTMSGT